MSIQKKWDIYEDALLVDCYNSIIYKKADKNIECLKLSLLLRKYAEAQNFEIDENYRNFNGINLQLKSIEYFVTNGNQGLKNISHQKKEIALLYKDFYDDFKDLLKKSNEIIFKTIEKK